MKICKLCYREFEETQVRNNYCFTCLDVIGKGPGYKDTISDEEASKWFEGIKERKAEFEKKNF